MSDEDDVLDFGDLDVVEGKVVKKESAPEGSLFAPTEPKPIRFSVSLTEDYATCPAKAYARITKQQGKKSIALVRGIAVHSALEQFLKGASDAQEAYKNSYFFEADRNGISVKGPAAESDFTEGVEMVQTGVTILTANDFHKKKVDPELVETYFRIERNGRLWVGKIDLPYWENRAEKRYGILDFKTGKYSPGATKLTLDRQFSVYHLGAYSDENLPTFGLWADRGVYLHLRGKVLEKQSKKLHRPETRQYSFPLTRTKEHVERDFTETLEPIASLIENNVFYRVRGAQCEWCDHFDKAKNACTAEIPEFKLSDFIRSQREKKEAA